MSADHGNAPDLDLLADFTAGVLDGTPEGAAVAERIAASPEWAELHAALLRAEDAVRADLTALPPPAPMPADVVARLDAALAAERNATDTAAELPAPGEVVPLRPRRGWRTAVGAVAAGLVLLTGGTIGAQLFTDRQQRSTSDTAAAPASVPESSNGFQHDPSGPTKSAPGATSPDTLTGQLASGTEYHRETLTAQVNELLQRRAAQAPADSTKDNAPKPSAVQRLSNPAEMERCLAALGADGTPLAVDFALFDGEPAVVIVLPAQATGAVDVAVVGPQCGVSGPDVRLRTDVKR